MTWDGAMNAVKTILDAVNAPTFQIVMEGEPLSIPSGDRVTAFWYEGDTTKFESLADVSVAEHIVVMCYWRIQAAGQTRAAIEREVRSANRAIKAGLRGDSQLGGNVTDLKINDKTTVGWTEIGGSTYRSLRIPVDIWMFETEPIAP